MLRLIAVGCCVLFFALGANAGNVTSKVSLFQVNAIGSPGDIAVVTMAGDVLDSPSCVQSNKRFVIDLSSLGGRAAYATVLAAFAQDKNVKIVGTAACNKVSYLENV
jgi:hypothetical protein